MSEPLPVDIDGPPDPIETPQDPWWVGDQDEDLEDIDG